ncbi:RNA-directed DNA polymerase, eukaryota, reverse transcriptase zinc-binding domain protein [Tanacetum coccineum]
MPPARLKSTTSRLIGTSDLWKLCDSHGTVADVYIARKLSKIGRRFGFVRFLKVKNNDLLLEDLNKVWIGSHHLYASLARFQRNYAVQKQHTFVKQPSMGSDMKNKPRVPRAQLGRSYISVINGKHNDTQTSQIKSGKSPVVTLMKKIKLDNSNLINIQNISSNILAKCVMLVDCGFGLNSLQVNPLLASRCIRKWSGTSLTLSNTFTVDERMVWIEIVGLPLQAWTSNAFKKVASIWGEPIFVDEDVNENYESNESDTEGHNGNVLSDEEEGEINEVKESIHPASNEEICVEPTKSVEPDQHVDPIALNSIDHLQKQDNSEMHQDIDSSPSKPPGFESAHPQTFRGSKGSFSNNSAHSFVAASCTCSKSKSEKPAASVSFIDSLINQIELGSILGYDMEGSKKDLKKYIDSLGTPVGRSGGILSIWDSQLFHKSRTLVLTKILMVEGTWMSNNFHCFIINVYAPQDDQYKRELWQMILTFLSDNPGNYILLGDFNVIRNQSERIGSTFNHNAAMDFNNFIPEGSLWDMPLGGHAFTRLSNNGAKMSKLDRFLITEEVMNSFPSLQANALDTFISDHMPILLNKSVEDFGPIPFKMYNSWFLHHEFDPLVRNTWEQAQTITGTNPFITFKEKMKFLKRAIKQWAHQYFNNRNSRKVELERDLQDIDMKLESGNANPNLCQKRLDIISNFRDIEKSKSIDASQKAKIKWGIKGDENSKYLHGIINRKRRHLSINGIMKDGSWITNPNSIKEVFATFFERKFKPFNGYKVCNRSHYYKSISEAQSAYLESEFSENEDLLKSDILAYIRHFHATSLIPNGCNSSFITLVPKNANPLVVNDYRPISLIDAQYKIIAKVLANRLSCVLDSIISFKQSAFVKNRQILDGPLMANEIIPWYKQKKKNLMIFKIDFTKAFDSVSWDFLDRVMDFMQFGSTWRTWIRGCLFSSKYSVLINGSPTTEFPIRRGLRQGDPLSPFLFILVIEGLHVAIEDAIQAGFFQGAHIDSLHILHLFFADDVLILGEWSRHNIQGIVHILQCFQKVSGLTINLTKSNLFRVGIQFADVQNLATVTGCQALNFPFTYLGLPINCNMSRCKGRDSIIEKFTRMLSKWKANLLSIGGRSTLITLVLGTLAWNSVLASKPKGGLGVSSLLALNLALIQKWRWRYVNNPDSLWVKLINQIHGSMDMYPDCTVQDKWNSGWIWTWSRSINGGATKAQLDDVSSLLGNSFLTDKDDSWIWSLGNSIVFNVKDTRNLIDDSMLPDSSTPTRWCRFIPKKVNILIWRILRDRVPTRWNLSRKGIKINSLFCPNCTISPETTNHLFWVCPLATALWSKIFNWVDILFPTFNSIQELYGWLDHRTSSSLNKLIMEAIIGVTIWTLWNFRNEFIFGAQAPLRSTLFDKPVYQGHKDTNVWSPFVYGTNVPVAPYNGASLTQDQSNGAISIFIKMNGRVRWRVGRFISGRYHIHVTCPAYIPFGNNKMSSVIPGIQVGTGMKYQLSQRCSVNV